MNELLHIRSKIILRIKSMPATEVGRYAKRMMRRCIKDIDKVIEADNITKQVASSTPDRYQAEVLHIIADKTKPSPISKWLNKNLYRRVP